MCRMPAGGTVTNILCPHLGAPEKQNLRQGIYWEPLAYLGGYPRQLERERGLSGREINTGTSWRLFSPAGELVDSGEDTSELPHWRDEGTGVSSNTSHQSLAEAAPRHQLPGTWAPTSATPALSPPWMAPSQPTGLSPGPPSWEALLATPAP